MARGATPGEQRQAAWIIRILQGSTLLILLVFWGSPALASGQGGYAAVTGPCDLSFPRDHGPHPEFRTEWWYYTGNLDGPEGRPFGFQLTFFRTRLAPPGASPARTAKSSAWRSNHVVIGHLALSDPVGRRHLQAQRGAREALAMAGARTEGERVLLSIGPWRAQLEPEAHRLEAAAPGFGLSLFLTPNKAPALHGENGFSRKGTGAGEASCYYSFSRLDTRGEIVLDGKRLPVSGFSWMDHEFSTAPLADGILGWDWFGLQLDDGSELMLYRLRREGSEIDPASSGTLIDPAGHTRHLTSEEIAITVLDTWQSPASGARYPSRWRIAIPALDLAFTLTPLLADQEMQTAATTGITYWEGSVGLEGSAAGRKLTGRGYAELTGYARPFDAPL